MDLDSVADELYGLPLDEFTAVRNTLAKQARADGERDLATQIQQLTKPSTSAWLVNRLAREMVGELEPLIDLGRDLREATTHLSGDELRALTRRRHQVVQALVEQARRLGTADGQRVSEDVATQVRQTLDASLADPGVADAVLAGRLTRPATYAGFGEPTGIAWQGQPRRRSTGAEVADLGQRRRESAERAVAASESDRRAADAELLAAERDSTEAVDELAAATRQVEELRAALDAAERRAAAAGAAGSTARRRLDLAVRTARRAERSYDEAAARLADLDE